MRVPESLLVHSVTVKPAAGESATGQVYGDPFPLRCFRSAKRRMVRDAGGNEVLSTVTLIAAPGQAERVPTGSLLTWPGGSSTVVASIEQDSGGLGAPDHTEVQGE